MKKLLLRISGGDNLGGYNEVELEITADEIREIKDISDNVEEVFEKDWSFEMHGCNEWEIEHIMDQYSTSNYIIVKRYQVFDSLNGLYFDVRDINGVLYYLKCPVPKNGEKENFTLLSKKEINEFNENWDYLGDNRYFGIDVYTIDQFNLEEELDVIDEEIAEKDPPFSPLHVNRTPKTSREVFIEGIMEKVARKKHEEDEKRFEFFESREYTIFFYCMVILGIILYILMNIL
jgi:hypothetical protein